MTKVSSLKKVVGRVSVVGIGQKANLLEDKMQEIPLTQIQNLVSDAGRVCMAFFESHRVTTKADGSPVTEADLAAHEILLGLPDFPVVSEEGDHTPPSGPYWLVDPLDGTRSFVEGQPDFTVNVALIESGAPVWGMVSAPAFETTWWGGQGRGAVVQRGGQAAAIRVSPTASPLRVLCSKNHLNGPTQGFIDGLGPVARVQRGSSLKFCAIAEGEADLYPRLGPCCEWDTAAGQAVLEGAGGQVVDFAGQRLRYGKADVLNPHFLASGQADPRDYLPQG